MESSLLPVDVIFLSGTDGEIRPLRVRAMEGLEHAIVGSVVNIYHQSKSSFFGAETYTFLCGIHTERKMNILELKYFVNSHRWFALMRNM